MQQPAMILMPLSQSSATYTGWHSFDVGDGYTPAGHKRTQVHCE